MHTLLLRQLDYLSEDELWDLAMSHQQPRRVRRVAMQRWLFPSDYGYPWAGERLQRLRERPGRKHPALH